MKVRFDEHVDGQRFYRQKRLGFHAMMGDPTKVHASITYGLYKDMGVSSSATWPSTTRS
ncbi:hypothetical protein [Sorangium sp. So ce1389]|uniref:hypothetical protein n=1 Tax=Sorangium sp. So ce1389 TaxID=3133336 RepID=UPI003F5E2159